VARLAVSLGALCALRQSATMKPVVAKLTEDDIIALAAYLGSK
jgi:cytochrome c553